MEKKNAALRLYENRKRIADGIFVASILILVGALFYGVFYGPHFLGEKERFYRRLVLTVSEAALVASLADYFAVTALTKQILWFKSTGLVPKKRGEIIHGVVRALEAKLFTKDLLLEEINNATFDHTFAEYFRGSTFQADFRKAFSSFVSEVEGNPERVGELLERSLKGFLSGLDLKKMSELLENEKLQKEADPFIIKIIRRLKETVDKEPFQELLERTLNDAAEKQKESSGWNRFLFYIGEKTNLLNLEDLAEEVQSSIKAELFALETEESGSERIKLMKRLFASLGKGMETRAYRAELLRFKKKEIEKLELQTPIKEMLKTKLPKLKEREWLNEEIKEGLAEYVLTEGTLINHELKEFLRKLIESEYKALLDLTGEMMNRFSDRYLVEKVNEIAGADLQWLRISGGIIGFIVGLLAFLIMEFPWIGVPLGLFVTLLLKFSRKARKSVVSYPYEENRP